jgi:PAS domain S-box-containing protein
MKAENMTNEQLILELAAMRQRVAELERIENDQKRAESELKNAVSLLNATLESTADGILVVDKEGKIVGFNRKFVQMWRIPQSIIASRDDNQALGFVLEQLKDPQGFLAKVRELYSQPAAESFDVLEFKDGRVFERYSQPQWIGDQSVGRVWSFRDVTERKQAEEALRTSEEAARRLAKENEVIAEMGKIISSTLNVEEVYERFAEEVRKLIPFDRIMVALNNPEEDTATVAYVSGFGIEGRKVGDIYPLRHSASEEVIRTRAGLLVQPETVEELEGRFSTLISTFRSGLRSIMTVPLISGNQVIGALHFRSKKSKAYTDRDLRLAERIGDQIAGAIANAQLFTERKQAEEALRESERRYRLLAENLSDVIWTMDMNFKYTYLSPSVQRLRGYSAEEAMAQKIEDVLTPTSLKVIGEVLLEERGLESSEQKDLSRSRTVLLELKCKDGTTVWTEIKITTLRDSDGQPIEFIGVTRDITERKRIEEEREKLVRDLQKALSEVKTLKGIFPICASCKIRDRSEAEFSHGICPDCMKKLYGDFLEKKDISRKQ